MHAVIQHFSLYAGIQHTHTHSMCVWGLILNKVIQYTCPPPPSPLSLGGGGDGVLHLKAIEELVHLELARRVAVDGAQQRVDLPLGECDARGEDRLLELLRGHVAIAVLRIRSQVRRGRTMDGSTALHHACRRAGEKEPTWSKSPMSSLSVMSLDSSVSYTFRTICVSQPLSPHGMFQSGLNFCRKSM
jgi:hypothetical protein